MHDVSPVSFAGSVIFARVALHGAGSLGLRPRAPIRYPAPLAIRITSPLGRTGTTGAIRIVAQVSAKKDVALGAVRFYVDNALVGEDPSGPPFAVEWTDENPFEAREISVNVADSEGNVARDNITLKPLEIVERTEISSVYVETSVQDKTGRFITGLDPAVFSLAENDVAQKLDVVRAEQLPATYTLLIDSSQSMSRRIDFVRDAATPLSTLLRGRTGSSSRRSPARSAPSRAHRRPDHRGQRDLEDRAQGGTAILDSLEDAAGRSRRWKDVTPSSCSPTATTSTARRRLTTRWGPSSGPAPPCT